MYVQVYIYIYIIIYIHLFYSLPLSLLLTGRINVVSEAAAVQVTAEAQLHAQEGKEDHDH